MRLALSVGHGDGLEDTAERLAELESAGLDMAWVGEAYGFDAPTLLGYLAARTTRMELGAGILNVFSRPATLIAQAAASARRGPRSSKAGTGSPTGVRSSGPGR
jgi:alkanesulfonate monooxygenase SsuD/methylene tetrahydromethanopterin reductase-like flavin-dependent oxidoreductase (luciferase family)